MNFLDLKKFSILYIEDDTMVRNSTSLLFENFFNEIFVADNGLSGYNSYIENKSRINLIISDERMPHMNGTDLLKRIRNLGDDVPFMIISAFSKQEFFNSISDLNISSILTKPIDIKNCIEEAFNILTIKNT